MSNNYSNRGGAILKTHSIWKCQQCGLELDDSPHIIYNKSKDIEASAPIVIGASYPEIMWRIGPKWRRCSNCGRKCHATYISQGNKNFIEYECMAGCGHHFLITPLYLTLIAVIINAILVIGLLMRSFVGYVGKDDPLVAILVFLVVSLFFSRKTLYSIKSRMDNPVNDNRKATGFSRLGPILY